eukprot:5977066-Alexandrium_andersonii.AAC.1
MSASLVGSEMCIRDRPKTDSHRLTSLLTGPDGLIAQLRMPPGKLREKTVSYTHLTLPTICSV